MPDEVTVNITEPVPNPPPPPPPAPAPEPPPADPGDNGRAAPERGAPRPQVEPGDDANPED